MAQKEEQQPLQAPLTCDDFMQFQRFLSKSRLADDRIVHQVNNVFSARFSDPNVDVQASCSELYNQLIGIHSVRESAIRSCVDRTRARVRQLAESDQLASKDLVREQTKLRLAQSELNIEEVVNERSQRYFHERCPNTAPDSVVM